MRKFLARQVYRFFYFEKMFDAVSDDIAAAEARLTRSIRESNEELDTLSKRLNRVDPLAADQTVRFREYTELASQIEELREIITRLSRRIGKVTNDGR